MSNSREIRHVAASLDDDDLFVTAEFERDVSVWSMAARTKLSSFRTILDYGGQRLDIVNQEGVVVLAGNYRSGLHAYGGTSGEEMWRRKDLKLLQSIRGGRGVDGRATAVVELDSKPPLLLDIATGATVGTLDGAHDALWNPNNGYLLCVGDSSAKYISQAGDDSAVILEFSKERMALLDAAFSHDGRVALAFSGVGVDCFDCRRGSQLWRWRPHLGEHALQTCWHRRLGIWVFIVWPYVHGGPKRLLLIGESGETLRDTVIDVSFPECAFSPSGEFLILSSGHVLAVPDLSLVWQFC